jgi:hypothetical protein
VPPFPLISSPSMGEFRFVPHAESRMNAMNREIEVRVKVQDFISRAALIGCGVVFYCRSQVSYRLFLLTPVIIFSK